MSWYNNYYNNYYRKNKMVKKAQPLVACKVQRENNKEITTYDNNNRRLLKLA